MKEDMVCGVERSRSDGGGGVWSWGQVEVAGIKKGEEVDRIFFF